MIIVWFVHVQATQMGGDMVHWCDSHILYSYTGTLHGGPYLSSFKLQSTSRLSENAIAPLSLM